MKVKSVHYGASGGVSIVEVDVADPPHGYVQIKPDACGICAWDMHLFKNGGWYLPGHEGIGRVTQVGPGVTAFKPGDRVTGHCLGFAGLMNIEEKLTYPVPESTLPDEHWIVEPVACCVTGIDHAVLRPADRVVLIGAGFMGLILIQMLTRYCLDQLHVIDIDESRLELARQFGSMVTHNSRHPDFAAKISGLEKLQFDTVIDASGTQAGLDLSTSLARRGGKVILFGWNHGPRTIDGNAWHRKGVTVINAVPAVALRDPWPAAIRLIQSGVVNLKPLVTHTLTLDEYPAFMEKTAKDPAGYIKGVVKLT